MVVLVFALDSLLVVVEGMVVVLLFLARSLEVSRHIRLQEEVALVEEAVPFHHDLLVPVVARR